ncbi:MAG: HAMP domain-containing histidine kinase [Candidatus Omnitrophica bacterium]|nr:HAMP domain-containing histidine kinase [Candidatus Omnitrophota bacterium]
MDTLFAFFKRFTEFKRLQTAYEQLDQQAKLIIRTDLELHRAQEELDRRLASLMALHQLGQHLRVSLRPEEVFQKLDAATVTNFGFSNALLGRCVSPASLRWGALIGVTPAAAEHVAAHVLQSGLLARILKQPTPLTLMSETSALNDEAASTLLKLLGVPSAVIARISPHEGPSGCIVLGRAASSSSTTKADEELVSILTNQLSTAIENSALYEKSWVSQQELERNVQQRTKELAAANAQLKQLNKSKSDFVSAVSHELRTPLAAIKGYASLLGSGQFGALAPPQQERIAKIEKHADLLAQFINNLLDIARIESGRVTMDQKEIPVQELLTSVHDVVLPQMEAKRIAYQADPDGITHLLGDAQHLQRVFVNLLSNAIKYTPEGGSIRLSMEQERGAVVSSVADTGCGIPSEELPKLFQEFYRANDPVNQQIRGTGLGLALVKRIVEAHHGRIWAESVKGKGSTFFVELPR